MAAMGSLVAGVAHEIRNPLFSISATVDALEATYGDQQGYAPFAGLLRAQVKRVNHLTQDLLDYGRPPVLRVAETWAHQLIRVAVRNCALVAREQGVSVTEDAPGHLPALRVDAGRIQQVIENLVANAIQHSPRGSVVRVAAESEGEAAAGSINLTVEDQGPGVSPAVAHRLFEPFFSQRKGGTGLGLSIVQRIVEAHGGRVSVENGERGARFRVTLPLAPLPSGRPLEH
jgi:signal transduction histidine kinase